VNFQHKLQRGLHASREFRQLSNAHIPQNSHRIQISDRRGLQQKIKVDHHDPK
jgi:hypothetical protein